MENKTLKGTANLHTVIVGKGGIRISEFRLFRLYVDLSALCLEFFRFRCHAVFERAHVRLDPGLLRGGGGREPA
ncbi:MAG TPA: hypothetical protein PKW28_16120, partial [Turneriella sp.]|nr:hypothetical protein [Turneriella sp.]